MVWPGPWKCQTPTPLSQETNNLGFPFHHFFTSFFLHPPVGNIRKSKQEKRREEKRMALSFEETNLLYSQLRSEQIPFDEIVTEFLNKINRSRSSPLSASLLLLLQASNALPFNLSLSLSHLLNLLILLGFSWFRFEYNYCYGLGFFFLFWLSLVLKSWTLYWLMMNWGFMWSAE